MMWTKMSVLPTYAQDNPEAVNNPLPHHHITDGTPLLNFKT